MSPIGSPCTVRTTRSPGRPHTNGSAQTALAALDDQQHSGASAGGYRIEADALVRTSGADTVALDEKR